MVHEMPQLDSQAFTLQILGQMSEKLRLSLDSPSLTVLSYLISHAYILKKEASEMVQDNIQFLSYLKSATQVERLHVHRACLLMAKQVWSIDQVMATLSPGRWAGYLQFQNVIQITVS